ncbi:PREDICTED: aldehyde dehydrogenase family 8 member A1 isoform X2 [Colobus angolensis palliatus]|uniref:Aldehyde dehydrogenase domain-containing protein n=1 Tax=Colobus angolensis palliatus TaxID=336983 RepID=A0A2K5IAW6_COLAP|nr:PREDICTED: aldehyde dehydrogenase family 8 member A1 isoform X2 [Colobus angolensis palliatus]
MAGTKALLMLENFIDGKFLPCSSYIDSYDPSTGEVYCRVPNSGKDEIEAAVKAAREAFPGWSSRSPQERSRVLNQVADLLEQSLEEFAQAESKDQGKTLALARTMDIPRSVQNFRFFASSILHHTSECTQMDHLGCMHYTVRTPVGVGVPPGVVNIVFGTGPRVGEALVSHPEVPLISFTGSQPTAERITQLSAPHCKKLSLELGGKNPAIIFEDANLDECIPATVRSSFANQGEICLCTSRIFVQKSIYTEFLKRFVEATRKWKVGIPSDPLASMGALISKAHLEKVRSYVKRALAEGAQIWCGEGVDKLNLPARNQAGYFMLPTVITDIKDESCCMTEEIFGPVTCVVPFDSEEEVIERANNVKYGLAATVWSSNVGRVHRVAKKLQSGLVWTNCWLIRELNLPFGGMKSSGIGREGAKDSYDFFTEIKTITVKH